MLPIVIPPGNSVAVAAETYSDVAQATVVTSATPTGGATVAPASQACTGIILTCGAVPIEYQRNGAGAFYQLAAHETKLILGITDASQIGFRRQDYATARTTQTTSINLRLINTSAAYSVTQMSLTSSTNATYTAFSNVPCAALWIKNISLKRAKFEINGGTAFNLDRNETKLITGITNANQVSIVSFDSVGNAVVIAETFQAIPGLPVTQVRKTDVIHESAILQISQDSGTSAKDPAAQSFATVAMFSPFTKYKKASKSISIFQTVANSYITGGTSADTVLANNETYPTWCMATQFGSNTAVTNTFTGSTTNSYLSAINTPVPIDVTGGSIHVTVKRVGAAGSVTGVFVDLFSSGTPAAPDTNYHTLNIVNDLNNGFADFSTGANGFGARSFPVGSFTAVGSGATLTAITYARIRVAGGSGLAVRPSEIAYVKNAAAKASVVFTFDDTHASALTSAYQILSPYGFPGVLYPSPAAGTLGGNGQQYGNLPVDNILALQHRAGWQIAMQDFCDETTNDMSVDQWLKEQQKNLVQGAALGFDLDGLRDASYYGGGPYYLTSDQYNASQRLHASLRQFYNGNGVPGDSINPFYFCDTFPPGDPWNMRALNIASWGQGAGTSAQIDAKLRLYVQQAQACNGIAVLSAHQDWNNSVINGAMVTFCAWLATQLSTTQVVTFKELRRQSQLVVN